MNESLSLQIQDALKKLGVRSLSRFHETRGFSFSYEYFRQIVSGERIPSRKKISEIASKMGLSDTSLQKTALEERFIRKMSQYPVLKRPPLLDQLRERQEQNLRGQKINIRLIKKIQRLKPDQKSQLMEYIRFLEQQWRRKEKTKK